MLKQFVLDLKIHKANLLVTLIASLAGALFGALLGFGVLSDSPDGWFFCMGALLSMAVGAIALLIGGFAYALEFQLALSMGRTRKAFMVSYGLRLLLQTLLVYTVAAVTYALELKLYAALSPSARNELSFAFLYNWRIILPVILALDLLTWFLGAIYSAYGKKGIWGFYFVWMFCCLVLPRMFDETPDGGILNQIAYGLRSLLDRLPPITLLIPAALILIAMPMGIIRLGRKQTVKL